VPYHTRLNRCWSVFCLQDLEYDNLHNPVNFINKYIVLPKNFTGDDVLSFVLDKDDLDEGEWQGCGLGHLGLVLDLREGVRV
jgi:hypothetical protein